MAQKDIFTDSIIAFECINLKEEFKTLEVSELEILDNILLNLTNKHKKFNILSLKSVLKFLGADSDLLLLIKDSEFVHLSYNGKWLGTVERPHSNRKLEFINILSKAIYDEIIPIDLMHIKEQLK